MKIKLLILVGLLCGVLLLIPTDSYRKAWNAITHKPSIYVYSTGEIYHCEYVLLNRLKRDWGENPSIISYSYNNPGETIHFYKRQIDSIVIFDRNIISDGLPYRHEIINGYYPSVVYHDTVWIKIIEYGKTH